MGVNLIMAVTLFFHQDVMLEQTLKSYRFFKDLAIKLLIFCLIERVAHTGWSGWGRAPFGPIAAMCRLPIFYRFLPISTDFLPIFRSSRGERWAKPTDFLPISTDFY